MCDTIFEVGLGGKSGGGNVSFSVGFTINPKELYDKELDLDAFVDEALRSAKARLCEHISFLVRGQLSALDATRQ